MGRGGGERRDEEVGWGVRRVRGGGGTMQRERGQKKERGAEQGASSVPSKPLDHVPIGLSLTRTRTCTRAPSLTQLPPFSLKPPPPPPSPSSPLS